MRDNEIVMDITNRLQHYGVLSKKAFGQQSSKWTKRFFVVKDGYLLYYAESERKEFEKRRSLNIHPKGIIPLGGCNVEPRAEHGHPFSIHISCEELNVSSSNLLLASDSEFDRDKWLTMLRQSCRVTWKNVQLGDALIQHLENEGLKMAQEKQDYFDQLQTEAMALHDEKQKTEELERVKEEMEEEKIRMEQIAMELKEEYDKLRGEMEDTIAAMNSVAEEKKTLADNTQALQENLEDLEHEKQKIMSELHQHQHETMRLSKEKASLQGTSDSFRSQLEAIESKTQHLLEEKAAFENQLHLKEREAAQLEEEKIAISGYAEELKESIKDISIQKAQTEAELKEEIMARVEAERRLRAAEDSLRRLEKAVHKDGTDGRDEAEVREEMIFDVHTLKRFFENLAFENQIEADKTIMIKSAIKARKTCVRRAQTLKYGASRKRKNKLDGRPDCVSAYFEPGSRTTDGLLLPDPLVTMSAYDLSTMHPSPPETNAKFRHSSVDLYNPVLTLPLSEDFV